MPHASAVAGSDDLASADEVKVYKDEGDDENRASENLSEDKIVLVTETEEDKRLEDGENGSSIGSVAGSKLRGVSGAGSTLSGSGFLDFSTGLPPPPFGSAYPWIAPYPPPGAGSPSAATAAAAVAMAAGLGRLPGPHASGLGLYLYGSDPLSQPPPAHMGIPPLHIDRIKTGLSRPPTINPLSTPYNPLLYPFYAPDFSKCWSSLAGYRLPSAFPSPYPPLPGSPLSPFGPASAAGLFTPPPLSPTSKRHPHASSLSSRSVGMSPSPSRDLFQMPGSHVDTPRRLLMGHRRSEYGSTGVPSPPEPLPQPSPRRPVIKKPLNAFMLFMKEMRQKVIDECTLKESAAINQILGRKWHALDKAEQAKYYEMARKEKELHMQLYPGWSARDNYGMHSKKKRKLFGRDDQGMKKCHSRFNSSEEGPWYPSTRSDSDSERSCSSGTMNALSTVSIVNSTALTSAPGL